jgi:multiple sugar transport system permease protein
MIPIARTAERPRVVVRRIRGLRVVQYVLLVALGLATAFPIFWMVASSLKTPQELQQLPPVWWPANPSLDAFRTVFDVVPIGTSFVNSFVIAAGCTAAIVATSLMAGFVFAKYPFRGRTALFGLIVATMFVPPIVTLVPLYWLMNTLGLVDSLVGVMLPQLANAFGIFLMRQFIAGVPDELIDAARVDGASEWTVLWRVVTPLVAPAIATLALFAFVFEWNSFLWPLSILQTDEHFTVVLSLNRLISYTSAIRYQNVVMAGALISVLPNLILFLLLQRYFVATVTESGVKG